MQGAQVPDVMVWASASGSIVSPLDAWGRHANRAMSALGPIAASLPARVPTAGMVYAQAKGALPVTRMTDVTPTKLRPGASSTWRSQRSAQAALYQPQPQLPLRARQSPHAESRPQRLQSQLTAMAPPQLKLKVYFREINGESELAGHRDEPDEKALELALRSHS